MRKPFLVFLTMGLLALSARSQDYLSLTLGVTGMTCGGCATSVTEALQAVAGVEDARTDFDSAMAQVRYDPATTAPEQLIAVLEGLGFGASIQPEAAHGTTARTDEPAASSCSTSEDPSTVAESGLSAEEIDRAAEYIAGIVLASGRTKFEDDEIEKATGVVVGDASAAALHQAVMAKIGASERGQELLAGSRCQAYEACSLYGNLSGATGEILAMYEREKGEDGQLFENFEVPAFEALDLAGRTVHSADLRGQPTLLAFLAGHCQHSMDTIPILESLKETYGPEGLRVVAVVINSGTLEDVSGWFPTFEPTYEVWVVSGDALGDRIGSHLVPTYLFIDGEGQITEKLVGFKESSAVTERVLARLTASSQETMATSSK